MSRRKTTRPPRPYYRFPWPAVAESEALRLRGLGKNYRQISVELAHLYEGPKGTPWPPGPATIRRLCIARGRRR